MKHKKTAVIFLGDYRYDGRCFNMVNSMIADLNVSDRDHQNHIFLEKNK